MNETPARQSFWFLNNHVTIGVAKTETAHGVSVLRFRLPFDEAPPWHVHHEEDEIFHMVTGEARFRIGDKHLVARAGDTILAPRGVPHGFRVTSPDGAEFLTITHGGFEDTVRGMARPADGNSLPRPTTPTSHEQGRLGELCHASGIDLIGPPIG